MTASVRGMKSLALVTLAVGVFLNWPDSVFAIDCNGNDREDSEDVASSFSLDCNQNGIPDECEVSPLTLSIGETPFGVARFPRIVLSGDLDGDDRVDLVTAHLNVDSTSSVSVLINQGEQTFSTVETYASGGGLGGAALGDVDSDGDLDVAVGGTEAIWILANNGAGVLAAPTRVDVPVAASAVALADANDDRQLDLVVAHSESDQISVTLREAGSFGVPQLYDVGDHPNSVVARDFNGDGLVDVAALSRNAGTVAVLLNQGGGTFGAAADVAASEFTRPFALLAEDFDADGTLDLAVGSASRVAVFRGEGDGSFAPAIFFGFVGTASSLSAEDVDSDGIIDLALGFAREGQLTVIRGQSADGSYRASVESQGSIPSSSGSVVDDFDGDGDGDVALLVSNSVVVVWNVETPARSLTVIAEEYPAGGEPHTTAIADLDGDGDLDLISGNNRRANGLSILMNRGNGSFDPPVIYPTEVRPFAVAAADLDGDGDIDLAALDESGSTASAQSGVEIQINNGSGLFERGTTAFVRGGSFQLATGDLDGDGAVEIVSSNRAANTVTILKNSGAGVFDSQDEITVGSGPHSSAIADYDSDGDLDIAVANTGSAEVIVLMNDAAGGFPQRGVFPLIGSPLWIAANDLDRDGHIDLVTANESAQSISILWNSGSRQTDTLFGSPSDLSLDGAPHSLVTGDTDGDGRAEVVTSNPGNNNVTVVFFDVGRSFDATVTFAVGAEPRFSLTGDVDRDGDVDIISANHGSVNFTVLFNQTPLSGDDFLARVCTEGDFFSISVPSSLGRFTKYVVPARGDDGSLIPAVFQNVRRFSLHEDFLAGAFPDQFPTRPQGEEYDQLVGRRATRDYYVGSIARRRGSGGIEYAFTVFADTGSDASEVLSESEVESVYLELKGAFDLDLLGYEPDTQLAKEAASSWSDPAFPILTEPTPELEYEAYTLGVGYGRVRVFTLEEFESANSQGLFTFQDIVVVETAPQDVEGVIGGFVTGSIQGPLSHVAVRTARRGTPNAFVLGAVEEFSRFEGELVRLEVGEVTYLVEPASVSEAEEFWRENQPSLPRLAGTDREYGGFDHLLDMDLEGVVNPVSRFGGKATNLARLQRVLTGEYAEFQEAGFGIPMRYYVEFMESNRVEIEGRDLSYQEYLTELLSSEEFKSDSSVRFRVLDEFRDFVRDRGEVSPALVASLVARIEEVFGSRELMVRFRSSSNVEDALEFNGAGLYESTSACAADTVDPASPDSSHCDATRDNERTIERALKKVWSSLWTFRAHEERTFFQIPPEAATMGLLVNRAFLDEAANGVAFTGNPQNVRDRRYMITAQVGEESVVSPAAGVSVERNFLEVVEGEVVRIVRDRSSSLVGAGEVVLTEEQLGDLGSLMWHVDTNFPLDLEGYPREQVLLDFEFKVEPDGSLAVKQVRPFLIPETVVPSPAFELLVPEGTVLCGVFSADRTGRDPQVEYELKSEVRLRAGVHELVTSSESFSGELIESVRFGPEQEEAQAVAAGLYRVARVAEGGGVTLYRFSYEQEFTLLGGESYVVQLLGVELRGAGSRALEERFLVDEEFLRFSLVSTGSLAGEPLVSYSSCSDGLLPRWELSLETSSGARIDLVERFLPSENRQSTGPASLQRASVVFGGGESVVVSDYWQLVYSAGRHNVDVRYWVVLDPEISVAGLDRAVRVVEVEAPDPVLPGEAPEVAQVRYLDGSYALIAEEAATFYEKGERSESLFQRGDVEADGTLALGDALTLLNYLFRRGAAPSCARAADVDDDGRVTVSDAVKLLLHLFVGGAAPEPPQSCGVDSSADALSCQYYEVCE